MKILWSSWCPSLFWVLDDSGILNQWDLTVNMFGPVRRVEDGKRGGSTTVVRVLFSVLLFFFFGFFFLFFGFTLQAVFAGDGEVAEKTFSHCVLFFCCFFVFFCFLFFLLFFCGFAPVAASQVDVVLCRDRSRASLVSLYDDGDMSMRQLDERTMRNSTEEEISMLIEQIGELAQYIQ